ncbi:hypothetical protein C8J57DRAFT_1522616 [Mycena rebaudengoi]|nr:hypothetical protein C8J57DRAFT_1522616 [Mycena rebaudengoi]
MRSSVAIFSAKMPQPAHAAQRSRPGTASRRRWARSSKSHDTLAQHAILVVLCALQYLGQIVPEHPLHANIQVHNRVPNAAPGSVSSPMASPAPHTLPPTVLSPLSPASVFFLAHACPPPHPAAAAPLPPSLRLSRHRRNSPAIAAALPPSPRLSRQRRTFALRGLY